MDKLDLVLNFDDKKVTKTITHVGNALMQELNQAIKNLANAAYAKIASIAQNKLSRTRQDYLKGLKFNNLGKNSYLISLDGEWANKIETGFAAYDMKSVLLASKKIVQVGSRSGLPWVQKGQKNQRFAHIPIEHKPFSKEVAGGDLNAILKKMTGYGRNGVNQRLTKIFKDASGTALQGKVAVGKSDNPMLDQIVKYQKIYTGKTGKKTVQSIYITYRTISDLSAGWKHPGSSGLQAFKETEKWVEQELDNIIRNLGK